MIKDVYSQCNLTFSDNLKEINKDKSDIIVMHRNEELIKQLTTNKYEIEKIGTCDFISTDVAFYPIHLFKFKNID